MYLLFDFPPQFLCENETWNGGDITGHDATRLLYNTAHRTFDWDGFTWSGAMCIRTIHQ
jgi:hypothetical protein